MQYLSFGREIMTQNDQWLQAVFTNEKKWNSDGPDDWKYYCYDLRKEKGNFSKRQFIGVTFMTWRCFSLNGVNFVDFI